MMCSNCDHSTVCVNKEVMMSAQEAVDRTKIKVKNKEVGIKDIPWIKPVELHCKYFAWKNGFIR